MTSIDADAFINCKGLTSVIIGGGVTSIGDCAFRGCSGLTSAIISSGTIGKWAFGSCKNLTSVIIGSGVTSIGNSAFDGCNNLTLTVYAPSCSLEANTFKDCNLSAIYLFTDDTFSDYYKSTWPRVDETGKVTGSIFSYINPSANRVYDVRPQQAPENRSNYWCTFYYPIANVIIYTNQIFTVSLSGDKLTLNDVTGNRIVPAGQAVVLKRDRDQELIIYLTPDAPTGDFSGNQLKGRIAEMTGAAGNIYVLNAKTGTGAGFYKLSSDGTIGANKAYLEYNGGTTGGGTGGGSNAREFFLFDEATGIESIDHSPLTIDH